MSFIPIILGAAVVTIVIVIVIIILCCKKKRTDTKTKGEEEAIKKEFGDNLLKESLIEDNTIEEKENNEKKGNEGEEIIEVQNKNIEENKNENEEILVKKDEKNEEIVKQEDKNEEVEIKKEEEKEIIEIKDNEDDELKEEEKDEEKTEQKEEQKVEKKEDKSDQSEDEEKVEKKEEKEETEEKKINQKKDEDIDNKKNERKIKDKTNENCYIKKIDSYNYRPRTKIELFTKQNTLDLDSSLDKDIKEKNKNFDNKAEQQFYDYKLLNNETIQNDNDTGDNNTIKNYFNANNRIIKPFSNNNFNKKFPKINKINYTKPISIKVKERLSDFSIVNNNKTNLSISNDINLESQNINKKKEKVLDKSFDIAKKEITPFTKKILNKNPLNPKIYINKKIIKKHSLQKLGNHEKNSKDSKPISNDNNNNNNINDILPSINNLDSSRAYVKKNRDILNAIPNNNTIDNCTSYTKRTGIYKNKNHLNKSFIKYNNNNNNNAGGSSINFSDTEIVSSCELTLIGEIFFNKEVKIDRSGIKNPLPTSTNRYKNKKKSCEIRFGVGCPNNNTNNNNIFTHSSTSLINKNADDKKINITHSNKNNKKFSIKNNQNKKRSISSLNSSIINKSIIDVMLNLSYTKIHKKIKETSNVNFNNNNNNNNSMNNNDNIILFSLKYDTSQDMFQLISTQDSIPIELLLNYNYPLRFQQNYNLLIGAIKMKMKVVKNDKNESILNIAILFDEENGEKKGEKKEIIYRFNPYVDKMPITIGRINCDINLNNISVSKLHAQIDYIYDYDEYFITDCKSTNGTYLLLKSPLNTIYVKRDLFLKLYESKFKIHYINFDI